MVLACDLHLAAGSTGVIEAPMAIGKLEGSSPKGQTEDLMAQTDPEQRKLGLLQKLLSQGNAAAHCRWISRPIGEKHPIRLMGHHLIEIGMGGNHGDVATMGNKPIENGPLDAEVNSHNVERLGGAGLDALIETN